MTVSDIGKLNRLVVPKQHTEKHFPLRRTSSNASATAIAAACNSARACSSTSRTAREREKGLRASDTIVFSRLAYGPDKLLFIDCKKNNTEAATGDEKPITSGEAARVVRLFGMDIAAGGGDCRKRERAVEMGQEAFLMKRQCVVHHRTPALAACLLTREKGIGSLREGIDDEIKMGI
ncbi:hypothetical protein OsI_09050 [Oryza sativa Indica Group]|uniref:Uncharacterized protein n=1 Tax=Oryza sativa subsp. indica TaxID=39946 RepID=B8AJ66_ORYSI|nr:hypothetical protein OsI_09050 [Oryza sativa Indica Group]